MQNAIPIALQNKNLGIIGMLLKYLPSMSNYMFHHTPEVFVVEVEEENVAVVQLIFELIPMSQEMFMYNSCFGWGKMMLLNRQPWAKVFAEYFDANLQNQERYLYQYMADAIAADNHEDLRTLLTYFKIDPELGKKCFVNALEYASKVLNLNAIDFLIENYIDFIEFDTGLASQFFQY